MNHLHFDASSGAAGDMILAALIDAGLDVEALKAALVDVPIGEYTIQCERVTRNGLSATHLTVTEPDHEHDGHHHGPHRHLKDMLKVVNEAPLSDVVKSSSTAVLQLLAEAEAEVHGKAPESVHFHEISGIDTLVDVIGACVGVEILGVKGISCSRLTVGSGTLQCAHGTLPLPAPATLAILTRHAVPFSQTETQGELLTPTGAALLAVLASSFGPCPAMAAQAIGYGAGRSEFPDRPNVLRAILGVRRTEAEGQDTVIEFRTVIDDMTPEQIRYVLERCLQQGALDAYAVPATMRKGRLGVELTVLAPPAKQADVKACLFRESSTFGLRVQTVPRTILVRSHVTVLVHNAQVRVKIGCYKDSIVTIQPEYEDCRAVAEAQSIPLPEVFALADAAARHLKVKT